MNELAILDLDLDFFVSPVQSNNRLPAGQFKSASPEQVEEFLERQCGLSKSQKILGRFCVYHGEAFEGDEVDAALVQTIDYLKQVADRPA